jgi:hypothetical protein
LAFAAILPTFIALLGPPILASPMAAITLGREPEPPQWVPNPGGIIQIWWLIEHETTPDYVNYRLEDPTRTIILDEETYPDESGLQITRFWAVTPGLPDGKYWIRVEYWSDEATNEANVEVSFYVSSGTGDLCAFKYRDLNCNGVLDQDDPPVAGWLLCIETPENDTYCLETDENGQVCWEAIPDGEYRVFEQSAEGWFAIGPQESLVTIEPGELAEVSFLNARYEDCYGACCLPDGTCIEAQETECAEPGGDFLGLGTHCSEATCQNPGACCFDDESCVPTYSEAECYDAGGFTWIADGTCEPNPCPSVPVDEMTWGRIKSAYR